MKATFLLALPRCGSLALSTVMNTDHCIAHHEGNDFNNMGLHGTLKFQNTYAYTQFKKAYQEGKNYFCCDTSLGADLFISFTEFIFMNDEFPNVITKALFIRIDISFVVRSLARNNLDGFDPATMGIAMIACQAALLEVADKLLQYGWDKNDMLLIVNKNQGVKYNNSLYFSTAQLTEIIQFVGAHNGVYSVMSIMNLARQHIALPPAQLRYHIQQVEKIFAKRKEVTANSNS